MTPATSARIRMLGLTMEEFADIVGVGKSTVYGWGKKYTADRDVQKEPVFVGVLLTAWEMCPAAIPGRAQ